MKVERIDHWVLAVTDMEATCDFYHHLLGLEIETISFRRKALKFGDQKIILREKKIEFEPEVEVVVPGILDIRFITDESAEQVKAELEKKNIKIEGIVERSGPAGKKYSIYFRDPDQHLIEVSNNK